MLALETQDDWSTVGADVTVGADTETWTLAAGIRDAYAASAAFVAWYNHADRAWFGTDTMTLAFIDASTGLAVNGSERRGWQPVFQSELDDLVPTTAFGVLLTPGEAPAVGTSWPRGDWDLQLWERRGGRGDACALGAVRAGIAGLGERAPKLRATLTLGDLDHLQAIVAAARNPRRGWVLQVSRDTWRQVELGPLRVSEAAAQIWSVEWEVLGTATDIFGFDGPG